MKAKIMLLLVLSLPVYAEKPTSFHEESPNNKALLYNFDGLLSNQLTDKISMRFITSSHFTIIQWTLKKGAKLPIHSHLNEQLSRIDQGSVRVDTEDSVYDLKGGDIMLFPPYVHHGFTALTDAVIYEQQTPIRQDFLAADFIQKLSSYLSEHQ